MDWFCQTSIRNLYHHDMGQPAHPAGQVIFACHLPGDKFCQKNLSDPANNRFFKHFSKGCERRRASDLWRKPEVCVQIWKVLIFYYWTSWCKHVMEKHILSNQTGFLSGQNLSLAGKVTCLLTKTICRLATVHVGTPFGQSIPV